MKITIDVPEYETRQIKNILVETGTVPGKISLRKVAKLFAQNIIDRYYSVEYLDVEDIGRELNETDS